jgi:hypothetical protein
MTKLLINLPLIKEDNPFYMGFSNMRVEKAAWMPE